MDTAQPYGAQSAAQQAWQQLLCRMDGVYSAHVVFDGEGQPCEIHVLANRAKNAKSQARDIQSALMAAFGVPVDHRIISVAQVAPGAAPCVGHRVRFTSLSVRVEGGCAQITVELSQEERVFTGTARGFATRSARLRSAALATLEALAHYCGGEQLFELVSVEGLTICGAPAVARHILCSDGLHLLGSAFVEADPDTAAVHCVLDALNRRLERLGPGE